MKIDKELILSVAKNARLNLSEKEINEFLPELKEILESFSKLDKVNTKKVEPAFNPIELKNIYREDEVEKSLSQEEALKNTKHKNNGYFKGPKAI
jgi:aspartyl-tRNA(Asn)/glutamyl-tRNA(Gln) amidotransferase subunit C